MAVCRHVLSLSLVFVVISSRRLLADDAALIEGNVLQDVRQVACQHSADGLVMLILQEVGDVTRTAVANRLYKDCSGNLTFHACHIGDTVVQVQAVITDLREGQLRHFTCRAWVTGVADAVSTDLGQITLTKGVQTTRSSEIVTSVGDASRPGNSTSLDLQHRDECTWSPVLIALLVFLVLFGVLFTVFFAMHIKARCDVTSSRDKGVTTTVPNLTSIGSKFEPVMSAHVYEPTRHLPPPLPAPRPPVTRGVTQYLQPRPSPQNCLRPKVTDCGGQGSVTHYQEPWDILEDEVSDKLTSVRSSWRLSRAHSLQGPTLFNREVSCHPSEA